MSLLLDPIRMIRDIRSQGLAIDLWGGLLNIPQLIGGLIFISTIEGQAILVTLILTLTVAGQIHKQRPFSRLIGVCHVPWLALLPWLVYRLQDTEHSVPLRIWAYYVAATIFISLIFDCLDLYRYARGEKTFSWAK
jgi:hypothetical protein